MSTHSFDPAFSKVTNAHGGYDPNEKGITQYPKFTDANPSDCSFQNPFPPREQTSRAKVFSAPTYSGLLDPVTRHYRRFIQDPGLYQPIDQKEGDWAPKPSSGNGVEGNEHFQKSGSCCSRRKACDHESDLFPRMRRPIDPVHWKPDLFDTSYEKYYLRNLINEEPYRDFLTSYSEATHPPHHFTEYMERYTGNPALEASSSGTIPGLGRPTDITEPCDWKRNHSHKLRDIIFTHEKDPTDSHLDYNDPKRYNPWGRHLAGHAILIEPNYRPRPASGIDFKVATVLPAVSPRSRQWIV